MKFFCHFCLIFFCILILAGCGNRKEHIEEKEDVEFDGNVVGEEERREARMSQGSIYEVVNDFKSLKLLEDAMRSTGLDTALAQGGPYTFFAPSDKALETMDKLRENTLPESIDNEELRRILLHHVAKGSYTAADLVNMSGVATLDGDSLKIGKTDNEVTIESASIIFADRPAENGYVHIIDSVLVPGS